MSGAGPSQGAKAPSGGQRSTRSDKRGGPMSGFYERLGVPRRINAAGTLTRLGGSLMEPEVLQAMNEAAGASVDMAELQSAASKIIASVTGAQAGIVTSGAAAGLTLATAACLARWDVARMAALPDTRRMPHRVLMARTQRNAYDHAIRLAGARIVDLGHNDRGMGAGVRGLEPWEIDAAVDERSVALVFVASGQNLGELPMWVQSARKHGLPLIADAAAQLPPKSNLRAFIAAGADLVVFSGGKAIGGPQASGILAGRADLVGSALLQMMDMDVTPQTWSPAALIDQQALNGIPHHGVGRGFKVGKEEIAGLLAALEHFVARDEEAMGASYLQRLGAIGAVLAAEPGIRTRLVPGTADAPIPLLELTLDGPGHDLVRRLQHGDPPVHLGERGAAQGVLTISPQTVRPQDDASLARCVIEAFRSQT
jgi:D-glucosaminate-6-phosphate ammonia-lyase